MKNFSFLFFALVFFGISPLISFAQFDEDDKTIEDSDLQPPPIDDEEEELVVEFEEGMGSTAEDLRDDDHLLTWRGPGFDAFMERHVENSFLRSYCTDYFGVPLSERLRPGGRTDTYGLIRSLSTGNLLVRDGDQLVLLDRGTRSPLRLRGKEPELPPTNNRKKKKKISASTSSLTSLVSPGGFFLDTFSWS